MEAFNISRF